MMSPIRKHTTFGLTAALALLAAGVLAPREARAACGDYLMIGGQHAPMGQQESALLVADSAPMPAKPQPCRGPNCSQAPALPMTPPAPPPTITPGDWACLVSRLDLLSPASAGNLVKDSCGQPVHRSDAIYHPPRIPVSSATCRDS